MCDSNCDARAFCAQRACFVCPISGRVHLRGNRYLVRADSKRQTGCAAGGGDDDDDDDADDDELGGMRGDADMSVRAQDEARAHARRRF